MLKVIAMHWRYFGVSGAKDARPEMGWRFN